MSEWSTRPRVTPMAGHRKATIRYCIPCETFHRTHRHIDGEEKCEHVKAHQPTDFPHVRLIPRTASR